MSAAGPYVPAVGAAVLGAVLSGEKSGSERLSSVALTGAGIALVHVPRRPRHLTCLVARISAQATNRSKVPMLYERMGGPER
jgi:hypothetical protein